MRLHTLGLMTALSTLGVTAVSWAAETNGAVPYEGWHGPMGGHGWGFMGPFFLVIVIIAIVMMFRGCRRGHRCGAHPPSSDAKHAIDILKERFANGEIDAEEYKEKKRVLEE